MESFAGRQEAIDPNGRASMSVHISETRVVRGVCPPERVASITGISAEDIRKLAREYATTQPSAIREGVALEHQPARILRVEESVGLG
jgi:hypothetical protein